MVLGLICIISNTSAQNYLTQSFDSTSFPPSGWVANIVTGTYNWESDTIGVTPDCFPHSGRAMAGYQSYSATGTSNALLITPAINFSAYTGGSDMVSCWIYRDSTGYASTYDSIAVYVNTSTSLSGGKDLGVICRYYNLPPAELHAGWHKYTFNIPASFRSYSTVYVIFRAFSRFGDNMYLDDISVDHLPICTGTPSISIAKQASICANIPFTLNATGPSGVAGITYQWQSATSSVGPWTNISGATTANYTVASGISSITYFRCKDSCTGSANTATSGIDTVNVNAPTECYCTPGFTSTTPCTFSNITKVIVTGYSGSVLTDNDSSCNNGYNDRRAAFSAVNMQQGGSYTANVKLNSNGNCNVGIWIDFNDDGVFSVAELIGGPTFYSGVYTLNTTLAIPSFATAGIHRMRIRAVYACCTALASIDPCYDFYQYGNTRDYYVNIVSPTPTPTISGSSTVNVCVGATVTLTANSTIASPSFLWSGPGGFSATTASITLSPIALTDAGIYSVRVTSLTGFTSAAASDTVNVSQRPAITSVSANNPVCEGDSLILTLNTTTPSGFRWVGPGFVSSLQNPVLTPIDYINSGLYTVTAFAAGCPSVSDSINVTVYPKPSGPIATSNSPICANALLQLTAFDTTGGVNFRWLTPDTSIIILTSTATLANASAGIYRVWVVNGFGCRSLIDTVIVIVDSVAPTPSVNVSMTPSVYIPGFNVLFTANVTNGGSTPFYQWRKNGIDILGENADRYLTSSLKRGDIISVLVRTSNLCATPDSSVGSAFPLAVGQLSTGDNTLMLAPNPNNGNFTVTGKFNGIVNAGATVEVYNTIGQLVYSNTVTITNSVLEKDIKLGNIPAGMYYLRIRSGEQTVISKFSVE